MRYRLMNILAVFIFAVSLVMAQEGGGNFSKAEDTFLRNKPEEAIPLLEKVVSEDPANIKAAQYLGIAYQQVKTMG